MCCLWLLWLSYQYLPSDWLERLLWGSLIMERWSSPEGPGQRVRVTFLVYCIASLFYYVFMLSPAPTWYNYFPTFMVRYSLFVLKVPLNPKQTNKQVLCPCCYWCIFYRTFSVVTLCDIFWLQMLAGHTLKENSFPKFCTAVVVIAIN